MPSVPVGGKGPVGPQPPNDMLFPGGKTRPPGGENDMLYPGGSRQKLVNRRGAVGKGGRADPRDMLAKAAQRRLQGA